MKRFIRSYLRRNAGELAAKLSARTVIYGKGGGYLVADGEVPARILRDAIEKHLRNYLVPTAVRISLDEACRFPSFKGKASASNIAWLVVVSDSWGETAYGIAQEPDPRIDPAVREVFARARAQQMACETLLKMACTNEPLAGTA